MNSQHTGRALVATATAGFLLFVGCASSNDDTDDDGAVDVTPTETETTGSAEADDGSTATATTTPSGTPASAEPTPTTAPTTTTSTSTAPPLEPLLPGVPVLEIVSPEGAAGDVPLFEWEPLDAAASYRLVVLGPDGPIWAWQGEETAIWLGGYSVEPPAGATPITIVDETCWSVMARDEAGALVAASARLPISSDGSADHTC